MQPGSTGAEERDDQCVVISLRKVASLRSITLDRTWKAHLKPLANLSVIRLGGHSGPAQLPSQFTVFCIEVFHHQPSSPIY